MPRRALATLVIGVACSLVVAWISLDFYTGHAHGEAPSVSFVYGLRQAPFLLVGIPLMLIGSWRVVRPWSSRRPWLPWAAAGVVVLWVLLVLQGPAYLVAS